MIISSILLVSCMEKKRSVQLELYSSPWNFITEDTPLSTLSVQNSRADLTVPNDSSSFTIKLQVNLPFVNPKKSILTIPDVLELTVYQHDVNDRKQQNYPAYPMPDGSVPVLEASLLLHLPVEPTEARYMQVGLPLAMLKKPAGDHEVILHFSGTQWTIYIDNELMDNDFPLGYPKWGTSNSWQIDPSVVSKAEIFFPGIEPQKVALNSPRISQEIQYWTPPGHNTWVGDVATFYHKGRYHIFYLYDRRGHASKFGRGAHYFEHISTADFKTWTEHLAATPIEEQWETFGTGTPFIFNDQLCISYGLHTTRIYPREQTTLPLLWDFYNTHNVTGSFLYDTIPGYPAGSTYSISEDGISNFKKTHILFHPCENPSVYTDPEGRLRMLANYGAKGTWESESIDGGWWSVNPGFPPGGDCTFFFRWGNFDYIIGGFTGLWSKPASAPEDNYESIVEKGLDFYNGMCVPAITEISDGRFLMAGWIPMVNWGGTLNIHEMIQYPDGRIGTKWMEEIIPTTQKAKTLTREVKETSSFTVDNSSFMLTFDVNPGEAISEKMGLLLSGSDEDKTCELQITPRAKRAQYGKGNTTHYSEEEKTLREGGYPNHARDYAIENLIGTDKPFTVRIIVKYEEKYGGSQIDTEIAGQRTMISFRPGLKVENLLFRSEQSTIKNVKIASLKN
ncbi:hypothetical protein SAMN05216357_12520 [Porphyromonadaceae bacterium KH3CP3RA]|nr:hypothetical protein SAMN05216357_12520 [Porphyromonadaceae bacterium KH3CP3RA]